MYSEYLEQVSILSDEQAGQLFKSLLRYAGSGEEPEFSNVLTRMAFSFISAQIRRDLEKWDETCKMRSEVGKKGGAPKGNRNAAKKQPKQPKQPENVCETVNENEIVTVYESETVPEPANAAEHTGAPDGALSPHTQNEQADQPMQADTIRRMAQELGISWEIGEAQRFLDYNRDRGRSDGWEFAIRRWEEHRPRHRMPPPSACTAGLPQETDYAALSNRFLDDEDLERYINQ